MQRGILAAVWDAIDVDSNVRRDRSFPQVADCRSKALSSTLGRAGDKRLG
ncbi:hypothetical protein [Pistricoccus aurantiacus]